jgi:CBS domain-containing protein
MMPVGELVRNRPVLAVQTTATVQEVVEFMGRKNIGAVPVMEGHRLAGVFSERDVINRIVVRKADPLVTRVEEVMTKDVVTADAADSVERCLLRMKDAGCRHLPILEDGRLVGMISLRDLLQMEITEREDRIEFLHLYLFQRKSPDSERTG